MSTGLGKSCGLAGKGLEAEDDNIAVARVEFDQPSRTACPLCRDKGRAGPVERIKDP